MSVALQRFVDEFMGRLANVKAGEAQFDPWKMASDDDEQSDPAAERRARLRQHLMAEQVEFIAIGEAVGFQGARVTGMAFTSEALLLDGAIPRVRVSGRLSTRERPWSEPSARIVWELLYRNGMAETTLLWNCSPLHPHLPGNPLSNRTPRSGEVEAGLPLVECLVRNHPKARVLAIGKTSAALLDRMQIAHVALRHPAYGGRPELERQLGELRSARGALHCGVSA